MKTIIINLILVAALGIMSGCTKETVSEAIAQEDTLTGEWNLTSVQGGLMGTNIAVPAGEIIWDFQLDNSLVVTNTVTDEDIVGFVNLSTGTYTYDLATEGDLEILYIEGNYSGILALDGDQFDLDNGLPLDGLLYSFDR